MTSSEPLWRGVVNGVLYVVQFRPTLDDRSVVEAEAAALVSRPLFDQPVQHTVDALRAALADGRPLATGIPQPHDEAAVRTFLTRLLDRLDAARPWPVPPYRTVRARTRPDVVEAPAIARVHLDWHDLCGRLGRNPDKVGDRAVLVLELDTGDVVAVLDDWDITPATGVDDDESTLVSSAAKPATDIIDAFRTATGLSADDVTPL